jgi:hypothetical protein
MKKKFWKAIKPEIVEKGQVDGNVASVLVFVLNMQRKWAAWMQQQTERLSAKGKLFMLIIFCAITTTGSIALIYKSFSGRNPIHNDIGLIQIPVLPKQGKSGSPDKGITERINRFRNYMDSLAKDQNGIKTYDSILLAHPGLMDSISTLEQLIR